MSKLTETERENLARDAWFQKHMPHMTTVFPEAYSKKRKREVKKALKDGIIKFARRKA